MGNSISQGITTTQFFLHGRKHFTATGWEKSSLSYVPNQLEKIDLSDKVVVVTGANSGIGRAVTEQVASKGARVYMVCRDSERAEKAKSEMLEASEKKLDLNIILGDCGLFQDVNKVVAKLSEKETHLDALVCNAGALLEDKTLTSEGLEVTFATHLMAGSYHLTSQALPLLSRSSDPRVVMVSSGGMYNTKFPSWQQATATSDTHKYDGQLAYAYAKRGQVLLCEEWAKKHQEIKFVSCHPGWTDTPGVTAAYGDKKSYLEPMRSLHQGSESIVWLCAIAGKELENGGFYLDRKPQRKHLSGPFFSDGSFTKNSKEEVADIMKNLAEMSEKYS